ncbi:hypothetical protein [Streptomyces sp. NPDC056883]|uniref:hypothetical protein n=1 Tax=Streptomyces sp. NPDC056883 TaxID=3345959 RepID=UPI0036758E14
MSTRTDEGRYPAVEELPELVQQVLDDPETTESVAGHVRWVHHTIEKALEREDYKERYGTSMRALLGPGATALCELTDSGELRLRGFKNQPKGVTASQRRRSSVLRRLAREADVPSGAISYPKPPKKPTMPAWARSQLHNGLKKQVETQPSDPGLARLLVVVGLVLDAAPRTGELCTCGIGDLAPDLTWVKIIRNPQAVASTLHLTEVWPVSPITQAALEHWLSVRAQLVTGLQGGARSLLVSHGHGAYRRGTPLGRKGLIESYVAQVGELKGAVTGVGGKGWELPEGLEQLRLGVQEQRRSYAAEQAAGSKTPQWGPAVVLNPLLPEEGERKKTAAAMAKAALAVDAFHAAREFAGDETDPKVLRARRTLREATRALWARTDHTTTLKLLHQAKLANDDLAAAGYKEPLLDALERA